MFRRDYDVAWLQAKVRHELLLPWLQVRGSREVFCLDCSWLGAGLLSLQMLRPRELSFPHPFWHPFNLESAAGSPSLPSKLCFLCGFSSCQSNQKVLNKFAGLANACHANAIRDTWQGRCQVCVEMACQITKSTWVVVGTMQSLDVTCQSLWNLRSGNRKPSYLHRTVAISIARVEAYSMDSSPHCLQTRDSCFLLC